MTNKNIFNANDRAYKITEVADILSINRQTVWRLIRDGKIKCVQVSPGRRAVFGNEINEYLKSVNGE
jgi:excisionase family DNA binding protein